MSNVRTVGLLGNPNCGKSAVFNTISGGKQKTGNWPGVTVELVESFFTVEGETIRLVDLPGTYSLSAYSEDEKAARDFIRSGEADLFVNILDASNLERNLYLTTHLIEMDVPMVLVLNMKDIAQARDIHIHTEKLSALLGLPVEYISAVQKSSGETIRALISSGLQDLPKATASVTYENEIEDAVKELGSLPVQDEHWAEKTHRWQAIKLLEGDDEAIKQLSDPQKERVKTVRRNIEKTVGEEPDILIADGRYGFIHSIMKAAVQRGEPRKTVTDFIDRFALNKLLGLPIFFAMMYLLFWATINLGGAFIDFFDSAAGTLFVDGPAHVLQQIHAPQWLSAIVATGVGGGLQTVATFIPIIFVLFFMLSLLEDSGYMARGAFMMDKLMRYIGLPGKAFIPLLVGFGCTVPAIMSTRTLDSRRDRILTIFMAPFMSCGARLPVYALFAAAFFPANGQNVVFAIYIIGMVIAVLTGLLLRKTLFKTASVPFVLELPPYHTPRLKHVCIHTWDKLRDFVLRAGKVLIIIVAILGFLNSLGTDGSFGHEDSSSSVLTVAGKAVTPIFKPFGVTEENWPASVGLFTGLFAKEVIVGTVNTLYASESDAQQEQGEEYSLFGGLKEAFLTIPANLGDVLAPQTLKDPLGMDVGNVSNTDAASEELEVEPKVFSIMRERFGTWQAAFAYLLFVLMYVPCLVAVAAMKREIGWAYTLFQITYATALAWISATLFYQITVGHSVGYISAAVAGLFLIIAAIRVYAGFAEKTKAAV
ncbi:MAG: Fe(2+) transporter permease subunit FeoB [Fibrobacterota bacterium]